MIQLGLSTSVVVEPPDVDESFVLLSTEYCNTVDDVPWKWFTFRVSLRIK